jgi:conjugal transfer/entry exclusion protein
VRDIEFAQLDVFKNWSSALATATADAQAAKGLNGALPALGASGQAFVAAVRQGQDVWMRSVVSLQADLLQATRDRADAARAAFQDLWTPREVNAPADPMNRARQALDAWIAQWTTVASARPVAAT